MDKRSASTQNKHEAGKLKWWALHIEIGVWWMRYAYPPYSTVLWFTQPPLILGGGVEGVKYQKYLLSVVSALTNG